MSSRNTSSTFNPDHSLIPYVSSESAGSDNDDSPEQLSDDTSNNKSHINPPGPSTSGDAFSAISATINNWRASSNSKSDTQAKKTRNLLNALASLPSLPGPARNIASSSSAFELAQKETNQGLKRAKASGKKASKKDAGVSSKVPKSKSKPAKGGKVVGAVSLYFFLVLVCLFTYIRLTRASFWSPVLFFSPVGFRIMCVYLSLFHSGQNI